MRAIACCCGGGERGASGGDGTGAFERARPGARDACWTCCGGGMRETGLLASLASLASLGAGATGNGMAAEAGFATTTTGVWLGGGGGGGGTPFTRLSR